MDQNRGALPARRRLLGALGALSAIGALAGTVLAPAPAGAETVNVTVANLAFSPGTVPLQLTGGEPGFDAPHAHVIWTVADAVSQHTVTFDDRQLVSSEPLSAGQRHEVVLYAPGTYTYRCTIHPAMTGALVVTPGPVEAPKPTTAPVRSPDARDPDAGAGGGSSVAPLAIGLSVLASVAVLATYLVRSRRAGRDPDPGPSGGGERRV